MKIRTIDEKGQPTVTDIPSGSHVVVATRSALYSDLDGTHINNDDTFDVTAEKYSAHIIRRRTYPIPGGPFTGEVRETTYLVVSPEPFSAEGACMGTTEEYGMDYAERVPWSKESEPISKEFLTEHEIERPALATDLCW